ncbi:MAG: HDOD domain-containing protein [Candidatus Kapaibacterium sp.]
MDVIENIIQRIDEFPTLPTIYSTLSDVMANPRSTAKDVADVIAQDQSSASKVLKTANSSLYGFHGRVNTISQAILYIGFDEVKNLIIALSIIDMFKKKDKNDSFNPVDLWKHSIAVGVITRLLGKEIGIKKLENFFISGILHDIGKLLFFKFMPDDYLRVVNQAIEKGVTAREAEAEILGVTHTIAGDLLSERWKLPKSIRNAISYHYVGKVDGRQNELVACVHLADVIACMLELGQAGDDIVPEPSPGVIESLGFKPGSLMNLYPRIIHDYEESVNLLLFT